MLLGWEGLRERWKGSSDVVSAEGVGSAAGDVDVLSGEAADPGQSGLFTLLSPIVGLWGESRCLPGLCVKQVMAWCSGHELESYVGGSRGLDAMV